MKTLVLITSHFPFGLSEPFPAAEVPYLQMNSDRIIIISQDIATEQTHSLPPEIMVFRYNTKTSISGFLLFPFLLLKNLGTIRKVFNKEVTFRSSTETNFSRTHRSFLCRKILKAIQLRDFIKKILRSENINSDIIFYSYWLNSGAHAISMLDYKNSIKIARAHGSDLYEEKTDSGYIPLLKQVAEKLDSVFFISEHGKNYFASKTGNGKAELNVSPLGIQKPEPVFQKKTLHLFRIISVSNLIPLKRINLIIEALALLDTKKEVEWIHFGTGPMLEVLKKMAVGKLGNKPGIRYDFRGYVPNEEIRRFCAHNQVDLIINTSSTEGVPVSIMEAQSSGIPAIGTDTGGVSEIITEGTGLLLPVNFKPSDLVEKISFFLNITPEEEACFREKAHASWERKFNAEVNYPGFISMVNRIFDSSKNQTS